MCVREGHVSVRLAIPVPPVTALGTGTPIADVAMCARAPACDTYLVSGVRECCARPRCAGRRRDLGESSDVRGHAHGDKNVYRTGMGDAPPPAFESIKYHCIQFMVSLRRSATYVSTEQHHEQCPDSSGSAQCGGRGSGAARLRRVGRAAVGAWAVACSSPAPREVPSLPSPASRSAAVPVGPRSRPVRLSLWLCSAGVQGRRPDPRQSIPVSKQISACWRSPACNWIIGNWTHLHPKTARSASDAHRAETLASSPSPPLVAGHPDATFLGSSHDRLAA